jgi:hypothetical protein
MPHTSIFRYEFPIADTFRLSMPSHAEILAVQVQHRDPTLWARVDPEQPRVYRRFRLYRTGADLPPYASWQGLYIATFQMAEGELVWHLFEDCDA